MMTTITTLTKSSPDRKRRPFPGNRLLHQAPTSSFCPRSTGPPPWSLWIGINTIAVKMMAINTMMILIQEWELSFCPPGRLSASGQSRKSSSFNDLQRNDLVLSIAPIFSIREYWPLASITHSISFSPSVEWSLKFTYHHLSPLGRDRQVQPGRLCAGRMPQVQQSIGEPYVLVVMYIFDSILYV